jgi:hypothetical protein
MAVTGGAGYIGSHTCVELLAAGHDVVVVDNLCNSKEAALERVQEIAGQAACVRQGRPARRRCARCGVSRIQLRRRDPLRRAQGGGRVHRDPARLLRQQRRRHTDPLPGDGATPACKRVVFSSSATVYGDPASVPIREDFPLSATNPYGRTKLFVEEILRDLHRSHPRLGHRAAALLQPGRRAPSGRIGEDPNGIPNNLMPFVAQVAIGKQPELEGLRRRLRHARRHRRARLHPRRRPGARPPGGAWSGCRASGRGHLQPRHRPWLQRAGDGARLRARHPGVRCPIAWSRAAPATSPLLCGPDPGPRRARLAGATSGIDDMVRDGGVGRAPTQTAIRVNARRQRAGPRPGPLRILQVVHGLPRGGLENGVVNLLNGLPGPSSSSGLLPRSARRDGRSRRLATCPSTCSIAPPRPRPAARLARVMRERRPDLVHCRNWNTWPDTVLAHRLSGRQGHAGVELSWLCRRALVPARGARSPRGCCRWRRTPVRGLPRRRGALCDLCAIPSIALRCAL